MTQIASKKSKRIVATVLVLAMISMVAMSVALAATQTVFSEDFETTNNFTIRADKFDSTYQIFEVVDGLSVAGQTANSTKLCKMRLGATGQSSMGHNWLDAYAGLTSDIPSNATSVTASVDMYMKAPSTNNMALITADNGYTGFVAYILGQKMRVRFKYADMGIYYGTENNQAETNVGTFAFNTWYTVTFAYTAATQLVDLYINGSNVASGLSTITRVDSVTTPCPLVKVNEIVDSTTADINGMMMLFDNVIVTAEYPDPAPTAVADEAVPKTGDNNSFGPMVLALVLSLAALSGAAYFWNKRNQAE